MKPIENLKCSNCNTTFSSNYCSTCGRKKVLNRIDRKYISGEISSVLNFDKGLLFTIKELLLRPGQTVRNFITEDRNRLVKPIVFIIVCSLIYTVFQELLNFQDGYVAYSTEDKNTTQLLFGWISSHYGYANILMSLLIGLFLKLFFRKQSFNYFEILVLLCFIMGIGMLLFTVFGILQSSISLKIIDKGFLAGFIYMVWAMGNFFEGKRWLNYIKSFVAYFLGMISFFLIVMLLGITIDAIIK